MLALGSGDPTRAICSSLIAEAFQSIKYPFFPTVLSPNLNILTVPTAMTSFYTFATAVFLHQGILISPPIFKLSNQH